MDAVAYPSRSSLRRGWYSRRGCGDAGPAYSFVQGIPQEGELAPLCNRVMEAAQQNGLSGVLDGDEGGEPPASPRPPHQAAGLDALDAGDIETAHAGSSGYKG